MKLIYFYFILLFLFCSACTDINQNPHQQISELPLAESIDDEFWRHRLDENGIPQSTPADLLKLIGGTLSVCEVDWDDEISWQHLGPFESENTYQMNQGRVESISVNKYNNKDIVMGSHNGGAYRTLNGGEKWVNTTDDDGLSLVGFHDVVRHPRDQNIIYAATGTALDKWNNGQRGYGVGIVRSDDGGNSWNVTGLNPPYGQYRSGMMGVEVDPRSTLDSTILYAITTSTLYRWTGNPQADGEWNIIFQDSRSFSGPAIYGGVGNHDIEIDRYGNVFLCNMLGVFYYPVDGDTMSQIETIPMPIERSDTVDCAGRIHVNPLKRLYDLEINKRGQISLLTNYYYMSERGGACKLKAKPYYYYMSDDGGKSWATPVPLKTSGHALPNLAVNQYDANIFYFEGSGRRVNRSINGGRSYEKLVNNRNHVDVRCLLLMNSKYGDSLGIHDEVYTGNDGGIAKLSDGIKWEDITGYGIANTNYFGMGITESDSEYIFLGAQDGSANLFRDGEWYTTSPGGDNGDCLIDPRNKFKVYQSANGTLQKGNVDSIRWIGRNVKTLVGGVGLFPMLLNPTDPDEIFAGGTSVFVSSNEGKSWKQLPKPHGASRVNKLAMSKADPNTLYYVINGFFWDTKSKATANHNQGGVFKAVRDNFGAWTVTNISSNLMIRCRGEDNCGMPQALSSVSVDPDDENRLWVTMSGFRANDKVFHSEDGGLSWVNISQCLPNLPAIVIVYDEGSNDGLYLGTDYGVFYKDAEMQDWIYYAEKGPQVMITDMEVNNASNELLVSTMGRGLWRVPLLQR